MLQHFREKLDAKGAGVSQAARNEIKHLGVDRKADASKIELLQKQLQQEKAQRAETDARLRALEEEVLKKRSPSPLPSSPSASPSAAAGDIHSLLKLLGLEEFRKNFDDEGVTVGDLANLSADELKQLVPKLGPRSRLQAHIAAHLTKGKH